MGTLALVVATIAAIWPGVEGGRLDLRLDLAREPDRRLAAITRLGARAGPDDLRVLRPLLDDLDAAIRVAAARVLARAGDPDAVSRLSVRASDPLPSVRFEALAALREAALLPDPGRRAAERALGDQDAALRVLALEVLGAHPASDSVPVVTGALVDSSRDVRLGAIRVLGLSGDARAVLPLLDRIDIPDRPERITIIDALGMLEGRPHFSAGPALIRQLDDPNEDVRAAAVEALGRLRFAPAVPALDAIASGPGRNLLPRRATLALGSIADRAAISALAILLRRAAPTDEVVEALKRAGPAAVPPVAAVLADAFPSSAVAAATILGAAKDRRATAALTAVLAARSSVAAAAARALGSLGDPDAVPALMRAVVDPRHAGAPSIRAACLTALAAIRDERASPVVARATLDGDPDVRMAGLRLAAALGDGLSRETLAARIADSDPKVRRVAIEIAPALGSLRPADLLIAAAVRLHDPRDPDALTIADALENVATGADEASILGALARSAESSPPGAGSDLPIARTILLRALARLARRGPAPAFALSLLESALGAGGSASRSAAALLAIWGIPASAERTVIDLMPGLQAGTRSRLCPALAAFESPAADAALVDVLDRDPDQGVRAAAAWAARRRNRIPEVRAALERARNSACAPVADNADQALRGAATDLASGNAGVPSSGDARTAATKKRTLGGSFESPAGRRMRAEPARANATSDPGWTQVRLLTAARAPAAGRWVRVWTGATAVWAMTDESGETRWSDLPPGPYRITAPGDILRALR